jgi:hypothetical protein
VQNVTVDHWQNYWSMALYTRLTSTSFLWEHRQNRQTLRKTEWNSKEIKEWSRCYACAMICSNSANGLLHP